MHMHEEEKNSRERIEGRERHAGQDWYANPVRVGARKIKGRVHRKAAATRCQSGKAVAHSQGETVDRF